jgi:diketogulonate reductase-like aldo/keto reductase
LDGHTTGNSLSFERFGEIRVNSTGTSLRFPARIGLGTWGFGNSKDNREQELTTVRDALEVGYRLIDSAELYGDGECERIIGTVLEEFGRSRRSELFLISKVLPANASYDGTIRACEASLERLGCEYIDLYFLHSRGELELRETVRAFEELLKRGLVRHIGVSNIGIEDFQKWQAAEKSIGISNPVRVQEIGYSIDHPGIEFGMLEWQRKRGIQTIAYEPLSHGRLAQHPALAEIGRARGFSAAQIALAWCLRQPDVIAIPKTVRKERLVQNLQAADIKLTADELRQIDQAFPVPHRWLRQNKLIRSARSVVRKLTGRTGPNGPPQH